MDADEGGCSCGGSGAASAAGAGALWGGGGRSSCAAEPTAGTHDTISTGMASEAIWVWVVEPGFEPGWLRKERKVRHLCVLERDKERERERGGGRTRA